MNNNKNKNKPPARHAPTRHSATSGRNNNNSGRHNRRQASIPQEFNCTYNKTNQQQPIWNAPTNASVDAENATDTRKRTTLTRTHEQEVRHHKKRTQDSDWNTAVTHQKPRRCPTDSIRFNLIQSDSTQGSTQDSPTATHD